MNALNILLIGAGPFVTVGGVLWFVLHHVRSNEGLPTEPAAIWHAFASSDELAQRTETTRDLETSHDDRVLV